MPPPPVAGPVSPPSAGHDADLTYQLLKQAVAPLPTNLEAPRATLPALANRVTLDERPAPRANAGPLVGAVATLLVVCGLAVGAFMFSKGEVPSLGTPKPTLEVARRYLQSGEYSQAQDELMALLQGDAEPGQRSEARAMLAEVAFKLGNFETAVDNYRALVKASPESKTFKQALANAERELFRERRELAQLKLDEATELLESDPIKAATAAREALELFKTSQASKAQLGAGHRVLGMAYLGLARYEEAAAELKQAVALNQADTVAQKQLARARHEQGLMQANRRPPPPSAQADYVAPYTPPVARPATPTAASAPSLPDSGYPTADAGYPQARRNSGYRTSSSSAYRRPNSSSSSSSYSEPVEQTYSVSPRTAPTPYRSYSSSSSSSSVSRMRNSESLLGRPGRTSSYSTSRY